ncbi:hypothetical protein F2P81_005795 [Scophthalmus maximus]|uniref:Uncharacterized protein n=1 Tax=Scophthalmus maximus TaxID=52904 RepID=A0A6A4T889_SCOMX|nr:hypothetical protein F2P81_005795 [Scophthalmus maximus]
MALWSRSFGRSSVETDCVMLSPVGLQHQNYTYNDVFPEPTDCHAAQCPIHQRYDPCRHQERFFSAGTPPPVPKKRLARTFSLPGTDSSPLCPWSPVSPLRRHPQNFDNPLYMLAPTPDSCFRQEIEEVTPACMSPVPSLSFSQLTFDTLDEHLPNLFSSFDDQRVVSQGIQHRHLLFLRSMAQCIEAGILLRGEATENDVSSYQPPDFLLAEGSQPKQIGDAVYYKLHSPKFPGRALGLKVHRQQTDEAPLPPTKNQLSHVNVQNVVAHFTPSDALKNDSSMSQTQDPATLLKTECTAAAEPPGGGSTEYSTGPVTINLTSVQCFLQRGHSVRFNHPANVRTSRSLCPLLLAVCGAEALQAAVLVVGVSSRPDVRASRRQLRAVSYDRILSIENLSDVPNPWKGFTVNRCLVLALVVLLVTSGVNELHDAVGSFVEETGIRSFIRSLQDGSITQFEDKVYT